MSDPTRSDPEAVERAIAVIGTVDLRTSTVEELQGLLFPLFRGFVVQAPRFRPGLVVHRGRVLQDRPTTTMELWHPSPEQTPLGRANRPGAPVLYCSTAPQVVYFECAPKIGDTIAVGTWTTNAPLLANHVGYSEPTFRRLGSVRPNAGWGPQPAFVPGDATNRRVADFLADAFCQRVERGEEYRYKLSAAIACKLFDSPPLQALIFPTMAMRANADNIAIEAEWARAHLEFVRAEFVRIDAREGFQYRVTYLDTAGPLDPDGRIRWRGRQENWVLRKQGDALRMSVKHGRWVAHDLQGNVVEPE